MLALEKSKYQRKGYTFPDGRIVTVQGFEPQTMDLLLGEGAQSIAVSSADMPTIMYEWQGKSKRYYPDCLVDNAKLVETKSTYTWFCEEARNQAKLRAAVMQGHDIELFVWKNKRELLMRTVFAKNTEPVFPRREQIEPPVGRVAA